MFASSISKVLTAVALSLIIAFALDTVGLRGPDRALAESPKLQPPPRLDVDMTNLPGTEIFTAQYKCSKDPIRGAGCSAGCASASFSPLLYLTVVLIAVTPEPGEQPRSMYYYLVQFPEDPKDTQKAPPQFKQPRAYGFTLDTTAICGTVSMDLEFERKSEKIKPQ
jgi:hypothetical protein